MSRTPSPEELKARAKRLADKYTEPAAPEPELPPHARMPSLGYVEDVAAKAKRYVTLQCRARKAEVARGKVSTLSSAGAGGHPKRQRESEAGA